MPSRAVRAFLTHATAAAFAVLVAVTGCRHEPRGAEPAAEITAAASEPSVVVPGNLSWVDSGVDVDPGDALSVVANGSVRFRVRKRFGKNVRESFGPEGTFHFTDQESSQNFP
ncbi:MAG: hypothetical protein O3A00_16215, partial [Planctomycetota bacterium]|nr:hypothetical protein [Planctomycetota bacterium]